ncbi:ROK family protein [Antricoccus suffuscus]|uniref:ROK family protein n=1 Tax=Antricoccus suffuscus TaxID=1629062 RepID=UPI001473D226|nr:ROK family protein [Antricoccus suffuscus]
MLEVDVHGAQRAQGRPALQYEFNPLRFCVVSLYVGLRYAELTLCDARGRPISENVQFHPGWDVQRIIDESVGRIIDLRVAHAVAHLPLYMGVVVHGTVDSNTGTVDSPGMGWRLVPLVELLAERIEAVITVHDASRAAALAESREGMAIGVRRAVVLNFGPEITATHIVDGVPDVGSAGLAGRIGRARIWSQDQLRYIDDIAGSVAYKNRYVELSGQSIEWATEVTERAAAGDRDAEEALELSFESFARASMWLITITNPERLILTGSAGGFLERWRTRIRTRIMELVDPALFDGIRIDFTDLGRQAWLRGGVHAVLDHQRTRELLDQERAANPRILATQPEN